MKSTRHTWLSCACAAVLTVPSAMGAFTFTNGDLILGFQATSGQGASQNVFFNLGAGTYHRDNPGHAFGDATSGNNPFGTTGQTAIGNVGATLTLVYGASWYTRTDLWFGVVGNLNQQPNTGVGSRPAVNGDPSRTFYLSTPAATVADGVLYAPGTFTSGALGIGGGNLSGLEGVLPGLTTQGDGAAILSQSTQPVEWNNSWSTWNPTPGAAFGVFTGGIQQNFGKSEDTTFVDLQRVLSTNTNASPTGVIGGGTYETTFGISSNGNVFAIPEPSAGILTILAGAGLVFRRRRA
jgi:hypothetical protein